MCDVHVTMQSLFELVASFSNDVGITPTGDDLESTVTVDSNMESHTQSESLMESCSKPVWADLLDPEFVDASCEPLSSQQLSLLFHDLRLKQSNPTDATYHMQYCFFIEHDFDITILQQSFFLLLQTEVRMRMALFFDEAKGCWYQSPLRPDLCEPDFFTSQTASLSLMDALLEEANRPFNLFSRPAVRMHVIDSDQRKRVLAVSFHHLFFDG